MSDEKSAIETWSEYARAPDVRDPVAEYLPLILSAAGALGVAPFAVLRWLHADWLIAIVDTLIVTGFAFLGFYVYRTREIRFTSIAIAILAVCGVILSVYVRGPETVYWAFPALMATFYLLKPREAILLTLLMSAILLPQLFKIFDPFSTATILVTILVTTAFAYAFSVINNRQQSLLVRHATKDPLTGAGNRRALESKLTELIAAFDRKRLPASIILLDLDHFKMVNDVHGHAAGDQILQRLTQIVHLRTRVTDSLYRIGGEEFVLVMDGQNIERASMLAEQLRTLVEVNELMPGRGVTISLGVAELRRGETLDSWIARADKALYRAKRAGRNRTRLAS